MKPPSAILSAPSAGGIYTLIQNLSEAERTAVRKAFGKHNGKKLPLHATLFNAVADGGISDDTSAQTRLGLSGGAQFSNLKRFMLKELLDTLVWQQRSESVTSQLYHGVLQLNLLMGQCQAGLARRLCQKLLAIAEECGNYSIILELLYHKEQLIEQRSFRQYAEEAEIITAQIVRYTAFRHTDDQLRRYMSQILLLRATNHLRITNEHDKALAECMRQLLALDEMSRATPHLKLRYFAAVAITAYMLQQLDICCDSCAEALILMEGQPLLIQTDNESFLNITNTAFYCAFAKTDVPLAVDYLERCDRLTLSGSCSEYFNKRWKIIRFNTTLKIAHKTGDYNSVARIVDEEAHKILEYTAEVLPPAETLSIIATIVISHFVLERYSEAEDLMQELKERNRSLERQDVFYFTLVFHLLILYELKDWHRLDAATVAAYHVLYNRKQLRPFEKELMRFLKALPARRSNSDNAAFIRTFVIQLEVYRADPVHRLYFLYFNYYDWLQSKLAGVSYREYKQGLLANSAVRGA